MNVGDVYRYIGEDGLAILGDSNYNLVRPIQSQEKFVCAEVRIFEWRQDQFIMVSIDGLILYVSELSQVRGLMVAI